MSPTVTIVLIVVALLVLAAIVLGVRANRRRRLQQRFGPEYDRAVADAGSRTEAERELLERTKRHAQLELRPLSAESRATYAAAWEEVQITFVDSPKEAVSTADELVTRLIAERGYPTGDYDERLANLSVEHAATLEHYRAAHDISRRSRSGEAGTEDLRQALVHYRALFADLLGENPVPHTTPTPRPSAEDRADADPDLATRDTADREIADRDAAHHDTAHHDTARPTDPRSPADPADPGVARSRPDATSR